MQMRKNTLYTRVAVAMLSVIGLLIIQQVIGINILLKMEVKHIFVYEGDIVLDAVLHADIRNRETEFYEEYCTYWSGFNKSIFTSTEVNKGQKGLICPYVFVNR